MNFSSAAFTTGDPILKFRFNVTFYIEDSNRKPIDVAFAKVSGLNASISTEPVDEGGQNFYTQQLPKKVQYENINMERGIIKGHNNIKEFETAFSEFKFQPINILISLLDHTSEIVTSWSLYNAFPVKWNISDMDANANEVMIENLVWSFQHLIRGKPA